MRWLSSSIKWMGGLTWGAALSMSPACSVGDNDYVGTRGGQAGAPSGVQAGSSAGGSSGAGGASGGAEAPTSSGGTASGGTPGSQGGSPTADPGAMSGSAGMATDGTTPDPMPEPSGECLIDDTRSCADGGFKGSCQGGTQTCGADGTWGPCSVTAKTDTCAKGNDDDCNGVPNENPACGCIEGVTRSCGVGGAKGNCAAGTQACDTTGTWGACDVVPGKDSCSVAGDDADCNGTPNSGCTCVNGNTQPCGPVERGICKKGESTCTNSTWGACVGQVVAKTRDCTSAADNDCDGRADNTLDSVCECRPAATQACGEHPGKDGNGPCRAGQQTCSATSNKTSSTWGTCSGAVGPANADLCNEDEDDQNCNGTPIEGCECVSGETSTCKDERQSLGVCASRSLTCTAQGKWPSCAASSAEVCAGDNKDEDCDGTVNDGCDCTNGRVQACGNCEAGSQTCVNGKWGTCADKLELDAGRGPLMRCVSSGTFRMGASDIAQGERTTPLHDVTLPAFWMDESEVTTQQYVRCFNDGDCPSAQAPGSPACNHGASGRDNHPINCLVFSTAEAFCSWAGKRLPTEEEWEYSARGPGGRKYPWGSTPTPSKDHVNADGSDGYAETAPVKSFPSGRSQFGIYDLSGNVREWTSSWLCDYTSTGKEPASGCVDYRMIRGGSYFSELSVSSIYHYELRAEGRFAESPVNAASELGFRCAQSLP